MCPEKQYENLFCILLYLYSGKASQNQSYKIVSFKSKYLMLCVASENPKQNAKIRQSVSQIK